MQYIRLFFTVLMLSFAGSSFALADYQYVISAIDDVDGDPTFTGTMTTTAPISLNYQFSVLNFNLYNSIDNVTYQSSNSIIAIETQGFRFTANDLSSIFVLTLYPDNSYFSEYTALGQNTVNNSGYFAFTQQVAAVPEPETYAMLLAGLGLCGFVARRKQKA